MEVPEKRKSKRRRINKTLRVLMTGMGISAITMCTIKFKDEIGLKSGAIDPI